MMRFVAVTCTPDPPEGSEPDRDPVDAVMVDDWVRSSPAGVLTDDQLSARIIERERRRAALDAEQAADVAAWDGRRVWAEDGSASPAAWLAPRAQLSGPGSRQRMKVCRWLVQAPLAHEALAEGRLSWSKVEVFARIVEGEVLLARFPQDEAMLVAKASTLSVEHTVRLLRHWASLVDPERDDDEEQRRRDLRSVYLSSGWLGMGDLAGNLSPELLLALGTLFDLIMDELYADEVRGDVPERTTAQRRHDALLELCRRAAAWDPQNNKQAHPLLLVLLRWELLTKAGRGAGELEDGGAGSDGSGVDDEGANEDDGDAEDADEGDAGSVDRPSGPDRGGGGSGSGGGLDPPAEETPPDGWLLDPRPRFRGNAIATEGDGPEITAETARRLACEAGIASIIVGPHGEVLDHGRTQRLFTPPQRRAILSRYGNRCAWPDCDRPAGWLQIHHIAEWERDGGPTDLENGVPLCSCHHHCVHEGGFSIERGIAGELSFVRPDGLVLDVNPNTAMYAWARRV